MKPSLQPVSPRDAKADSATYELHRGDLPDGLALGPVLAINGEYMGANVARDRLCVLQIYDGTGKVHIVQFATGRISAPNVAKLLADKTKEKVFFFARGDMKWLGHYIGVIPENVYCIKTASRIARTYTQSHELEDVGRQLLGIRLSKEQQSSDWGAPELSPAQLDYAANDVLHLHTLRQKLNEMMAKEGRSAIAEGLFRCIPAIVAADLGGWGGEDLFSPFVPRPT